MSISVRSRPNYYELLSLSPTASDEEIRQAFARLMGMFGAHTLAGAASLSAAFEVLRDPVKRRTYDSSLGINPKPRPVHWKVTGVARTSQQLFGPGWGRTPDQDAGSGEAFLDIRPERPQVAVSDVETGAVPSPSPRQPAPPSAPETSHDVSTEADSRRQREERLSAGAAREILAARGGDAKNLLDFDIESRPLNWRGPALAFGGLVLAAGLVGALAGLSAQDDEQPPPAKRGVTVALPAAKLDSNSAVLPPVATDARRRTTASARAPIRPSPIADQLSKPKIASLAGQQVDNDQSAQTVREESQPIAATSAPSATVSGIAKAAAPNLSLSNRTIARTIERIGYSCGSVVSTIADEGGAPGVYKVTCGSGQTFRATPVGGRYRFRRIGSP